MKTAMNSLDNSPLPLIKATNRAISNISVSTPKRSRSGEGYRFLVVRKSKSFLKTITLQPRYTPAQIRHKAYMYTLNPAIFVIIEWSTVAYYSTVGDRSRCQFSHLCTRARAAPERSARVATGPV